MNKRKIGIALVALVICMCFTACTTWRSYTFDVATNEQARVRLDTSAGHKLVPDDAGFTVKSKDDEILTIGYFQTEETINRLFATLEGGEGVTIINQQDKNGQSYIFYAYEQNGVPVWNYVFKADDTVTGIALTNAISRESAEMVWELLQFDITAK